MSRTTEKVSKAVKRRQRSRNSLQWYQARVTEGFTFLEVTFNTPLMDVSGWSPTEHIRAVTMQHPTLPQCTIIYAQVPPYIKELLRQRPPTRGPLTLMCQMCIYMCMIGPQNPMPADKSVFTSLPVHFR